MKTNEYSINVDEASKGCRLDQFLFDWLNANHSPISKGAIRKVLVGGGVYLNNRRVKIASKPVIPGAQIKIHIKWDQIGKIAHVELPLEYFESNILFEDSWLIVVNKPAGIPTQATVDQSRDSLYEKLRMYLAKRDSIAKPKVYLGLHHRLDRDTTGVILFTKDPKANRPISEQFQGRQIQKSYLACAVGKRDGLESKFIVNNCLKKRPSSHRVDIVKSGGKPAETRFEILDRVSKGGLSAYLLRCKPLTGRTHQIRVHLASVGAPIFGDKTYGGKETWGPYRAERMLLHAESLKFSHPISLDDKIEITSQIPKDFFGLFPTSQT